MVAEAGVAKSTLYRDFLRLLAVFDALDTWFHRHDFEGCVFINSLLESHGQSSPVRSASIAGMTRVRAGLVLERAGIAASRDTRP